MAEAAKASKMKDTNNKIIPVTGIIALEDIRVSISIVVIIPFSG